MGEAQWLFTESHLLHTPSVVAGLSPTQERENRAKGVHFILQVGMMLKIPQTTIAVASVYLHRFFMRVPMIEDKVTGQPHQHYYSIAATCLFSATKVEEHCRKMKDLVIACVRVAQKDPDKDVDEQDKEFWRWRDVLIQMEDVLLETLCFDLTVQSPYKLLYSYLKHFGQENNKPLRNAAWAFINDSCLTPLCLLYPARTIAAAAIYCAARHCDVQLMDDEKGKPWWEFAGNDLTSIRKACNYMISLYENVSKGSNGDGKTSIYQHTPESSGEEKFAKTRAYRPGASPSDSRQSTPLEGPLSRDAPLQTSADLDEDSEGEIKEEEVGEEVTSKNNPTQASSGKRSHQALNNSTSLADNPSGDARRDIKRVRTTSPDRILTNGGTATTATTTNGNGNGNGNTTPIAMNAFTDEDDKGNGSEDGEVLSEPPPT